MRIPRKDKQKMFYSLYVGSKPVYAKDSEGNIITTKVDGVDVPVELGTIENTYSDPKEFLATISSSLNELHAKEYGVDASAIYSEIQCEKGYVPLAYGAKIWRETTPTYKADGTVDDSTADYVVKGVMTEFIPYDWYLLQRQNNNG